MRWSPQRGQRSQISVRWQNERKRQTLIECRDVVRRSRRMKKNKVLTPDFNNERSGAQQSERSSHWKWAIEKLPRTAVSSGWLKFAYESEWVAVLGGESFPQFLEKSLSGLWRHRGTGGESTVGQGRAIAFTGSWVSRLLRSEWRGCVVGPPPRTRRCGKQFTGTKCRGQFSGSVREKSMTNPGGIGEVGRSFYTDFTDVFTKGKFSIWDNPPD